MVGGQPADAPSIKGTESKDHWQLNTHTHGTLQKTHTSLSAAETADSDRPVHFDMTDAAAIESRPRQQCQQLSSTGAGRNSEIHFLFSSFLAVTNKDRSNQVFAACSEFTSC